MGPQGRVYPFAIAYVSTNFRRKIEYRYFAGAGVTWQVVKTRPWVLKLSASAVHESTQFDGTVYNRSEYDGKGKISLWRGTLHTAGFQHAVYLYARKCSAAKSQTGRPDPDFRTGL